MYYIYVYICLPHFLLFRKNFFSKIIINNYRIVHQKNHIKNNSDLTFQLTAALASVH